MFKVIPIAALLFATNGQEMNSRRLLASDNPFCDSDTMFKDALTALSANPSTAFDDLCNWAQASCTNTGANVAAASAAGNADFDALTSKISLLADIEEQCATVWGIHSSANSAGESDLSTMKAELAAAFDALDGGAADFTAAQDALDLVYNEAAAQTAHYATMALLHGVNIMDIIGSTYLRARDDLIKVQPTLSKEYSHTNWYWHAKPLYDLIYGFLRPPHYEISAHGAHRDWIFHPIDQA